MARTLLHSGSVNSSRAPLFLRFFAFVVAIAGAVFFVPSIPVYLGWGLLGLVRAGADFGEGHFGIGVLRLAGASLYIAALLFAAYLCYSLVRYALQRSEQGRGRRAWGGASLLCGIVTAVIAGCGVFYHDPYSFRESPWPAGFAVLAGVCCRLTRHP